MNYTTQNRQTVWMLLSMYVSNCYVFYMFDWSFLPKHKIKIVKEVDQILYKSSVKVPHKLNERSLHFFDRCIPDRFMMFAGQQLIWRVKMETRMMDVSRIHQSLCHRSFPLRETGCHGNVAIWSKWSCYVFFFSSFFCSKLGNTSVIKSALCLRCSLNMESIAWHIHYQFVVLFICIFSLTVTVGVKHMSKTHHSVRHGP